MKQIAIYRNQSINPLHVLISMLCFSIFWLYRSQYYAGDGALIARITEGGKWIVKNELLSQAILQLSFRFFQLWNWTVLETMNMLSCLSAAIAICLLLHYSWRLYHIAFPWPLLLYFSSGFMIYGFGHTEYYPMLLPAMLLYGFIAVQYLRGQAQIVSVALVFVLASALHFAMLIALPSLLLLPCLTKRWIDSRKSLTVLLLFIPLVFIRNFPQWLGYKASGLSPAINFLPLFPFEGMIRHYAFFDLDHLWDWLYGWTMRSWIYWPAILWQAGVHGLRSLVHPERLFLLVYTLCFTAWTFMWHPDLGMMNDWDLFALEAAPCLLLLLTYMPQILKYTFSSTFIAVACIASAIVLFTHVLHQADLPRSGYGQLVVQEKGESNRLVLDGLAHPTEIPRLREGTYNAKWINTEDRFVYDFYVTIHAGRKTVIDIPTEPAAPQKP